MICLVAAKRTDGLKNSAKPVFAIMKCFLILYDNDVFIMVCL